MSKVLLVFLFISFFTLPLFAQSVDTAWVRRYNGPGNSTDEAYAIAVDDSGNVYVTGYSKGSGTYYDYATIKYDPNGDTAWVRRFDGPGNSTDEAHAIAVDGSGNVYVTGWSEGSGSDCDYATIKYDPNGNELWVQRYNGPGDYWDYAGAIAVDGSGNIYVTGYSKGSGTYYDYATIKYDPDGNQLWVQRYNGPGNGEDYANAIAVDGSGNVYVTGYSYGSGTGNDYATIKYDPDGNQLWGTRYNGPGNSEDESNAIAIDDSGNVYVTGFSYSTGTEHDYATIKYDPDGNQLWVTRYNGPENYSYDYANAIAVNGSGNVYVTGKSLGSGTYWDYATIKYDPDGNQLWGTRYNGPGNSEDESNAIAIDDSGNVYVTGFSYSTGTEHDYATIKYDPDGNELWVRRYNGPVNRYSEDESNAIAIDDSGNVYVTGKSACSGTYYDYDYATIKYCQDNPPNPFSLFSPTDSSFLSYIVTFDWEITADPDSLEQVKYDLYLSTSSSFHLDSTLIYNNLSNNQHTDTLELGRYYWKVRAYIRCAEKWSDQTGTFLSAIRGDANADKKITVSDVVYLVNYLFKGGPKPIPELIVGDANCDGKATVSDVIYLINYLFKDGPEPCI